MNTTETQMCSLRRAAGLIEACTRDDCPFWEPGGAVIESRCVLERLGVDLDTPGLAEYLLDTRERLEGARTSEEAEEAHREFARRLGRDV